MEIFSTVRDLVKWDNALAAGKVVKRSSLEQMWTPVRLNSGGSFPYAFAWGMDERRGHRMLTHTGITGTEYTRFPDDKLTVIVLTNLGSHIGGEFMEVNERSRRAPYSRFPFRFKRAA
jgi:D-alanyl-D-alanine carboxypeptidase